MLSAGPTQRSSRSKATATVTIWAGAVAAIITDGVEAEDIIMAGGTIVTEHVLRF